MNLVIIKGNLTRDPELTYLPNGTPVAKVGVAVNEVWYNDQQEKQERVNFFDVTFWGRTAETFAQFFTKGKPVLLTGRLRQDTWNDKQTGEKRNKVGITGDRWEFAGGDMARRPAAAPGEAPQVDANYDKGDASPISDYVPF